MCDGPLSHSRGFVIPRQLASKSLSVEGERALLTLASDTNGDNLTGLQFSEKDPFGQRILDLTLDRATQRARTQNRIEAHVREQLAGRVRQLQAHILRLHTLRQLRNHQVDDARNLRLGQRREHDRVVDTVEELRAEVLLELLRNLRLHTAVVVRRVFRGLEAREDTLVDVASTQVRRHDNDGVLEVHLATLRVRQATLLQDLEQRVEDIRVSLLDLVEEDDRERLATDLLRELAALVVADVAGRGAEEARDRVLLGELGQVELDEG